MKMWIPAFAVLLVVIASGQVRLAGQDKKEPAKDPKEESIEVYDSKTKGALSVKVDQKDPTDSFDVLQDGKRSRSKTTLRSSSTAHSSCLPECMSWTLNKTQRKVTIEAGKKTIFWTGELVVEGKPETMAWYAHAGQGKTHEYRRGTAPQSGGSPVPRHLHSVR